MIRKLAKSSYKDLEIIAAPTVRESDGLALSSRNIRLNKTDREAATVIFKALVAAKNSQTLEEARRVIFEISSQEPLFKLDYAEVIDEADFAIATQSTLKQRAIIAGWLNGVRLIDNMEMNLSSETPGAR